jgi:hypothetical protein
LILLDMLTSWWSAYNDKLSARANNVKTLWWKLILTLQVKCCCCRWRYFSRHRFRKCKKVS